MPDHIVRMGLTGLHIYLNNLSPGQTAKFILITEEPAPETYWKSLTTYLGTLEGVNVIEAEYETGLITITCTAESLRKILKSELSEDLVAINNDPPAH